MPQAKRSKSNRVPARTRGRPSVDQAAQIDLEVLLAARKLFFELGYERTSMAMIIKAAGVSKTTLYARYAQKADLFRATVAYTLECIGAISFTSERDGDDLQLGLTRFGYEAIMISMTDWWLSYERLVYAEGARFPELIEGIADRLASCVCSVAAFIRECAERDGVACADPDAIATIYVMALRGYYTAAVLSNQVRSEAEYHAFVDSLVATLVAGRASW